jgi:indole-3-glycerol phosphate synthase
MAAIGVRCFLIGESLMRKENVRQATQHILANPIRGDG